jgi:peptide/nickel transport system substrate-binding protein
LPSKVLTLNPVLAESMAERHVASYLHTPLLHLDRNLKVTRGLAKEWSVSEDGKTYEFELDPQATFSDGSPVRASDVVFTLKKGRESESQASQMATLFAELDVERTKAVDEHKVIVGFRRTSAEQLLAFNRLYVVPEHVYGKGRFRDDFNETVVGTGPYTLVSWARHHDIALKRREKFWRDEDVVAEILLRVIENDRTAWDSFQKGELDETRITSDMWNVARNDPRYAARIKQFYTFNYEAIAWNGRHPLLRDRRMRRALALCVPVQSIIDNVYHGTARRLSGPFMPGGNAANPKVSSRYDPTEAKRLLAELGWRDHDGDGSLDRDGAALAFEVVYAAGNSSAGKTLQFFQGELKRIGVTLTVTPMEGASFGKHVLGGRYEAAYFAKETGPIPDPYSSLHTSGSSNFVSYSNPKADRLMEMARGEVDEVKRDALYRELHVILAEDQPVTWLMQVQDKWVVSERLKGVSVNDGYGLFRWYPGELAWRLAVPAAPARQVAQRSSLRSYRVARSDFYATRGERLDTHFD